tara:strand:+ start:896 stop:1303 length:408 start_codon:yes stop_codon:yes gene_type:complete
MRTFSAGTKEMIEEQYHQFIKDVLSHSEIEEEIAEEIVNLSFMLWKKAVYRVGRVPSRLAVDCIYVISLLSGYRISKKNMVYATSRVLEDTRGITPMVPSDDGSRWVKDEKWRNIILDLIPNESAFDEMAGAWKT